MFMGLLILGEGDVSYRLIQVSPEKGLAVGLTGSAADGVPPTTESPSILEVQWQCK